MNRHSECSLFFDIKQFSPTVGLQLCNFPTVRFSVLGPSTFISDESHLKPSYFDRLVGIMRILPIETSNLELHDHSVASILRFHA